MLEDAREAPLNIFLTIPSTIPATNAELETAGGDLTPEKVGAIFDAWPEAVALGEKMDFRGPSASGMNGAMPSSPKLSREADRSRAHIYGREFVGAYAASGVTDTHEAIDREIADDFIEAGIWIFLRGGPPTTPWHSLPEAIKTVTELGASHKRVCLCTDDRDADDLFLFGLDWVARQAVAAGMSQTQAWSMGSLHPATRYGMDSEIGGLGHSRRGRHRAPRRQARGAQYLVRRGARRRGWSGLPRYSMNSSPRTATAIPMRPIARLPYRIIRASYPTCPRAAPT